MYCCSQSINGIHSFGSRSFINSRALVCPKWEIRNRIRGKTAKETTFLYCQVRERISWILTHSHSPPERMATPISDYTRYLPLVNDIFILSFNASLSFCSSTVSWIFLVVKLIPTKRQFNRILATKCNHNENLGCVSIPLSVWGDYTQFQYWMTIDHIVESTGSI